MFRSILLPESAPGLVRAAQQKVLLKRFSHYNYRSGTFEVMSVMEFLRLNPHFTVRHLKTIPRYESAFDPASVNGLEFREWQAMHLRIQNHILDAIPRFGIYQNAYDDMPLSGMVWGAMEYLGKPILNVHTNDWRRDKTRILRDALAWLGSHQYPITDELVRQLGLASSYSRAETSGNYMDRDGEIYQFGYWNKHLPVTDRGVRVTSAVRSI